MKSNFSTLIVLVFLSVNYSTAQVPNDIEIVSTWIRGEFNNGIQYGRTPEDQQDANYWVGAEIHNSGTNDQTNINFSADYGSFISSGTVLFLAADSTVVIETLETLSLVQNLYSGNCVVSSDADTLGGANFGDNSRVNKFEVTSSMDGQYSIDGIGMYSNPIVSAIGSNSFFGGADGLVLASKYSIKNPVAIQFVRVLLADSTIAGADIYSSIKDSSTFWAGDMASLYYAEPIMVSNYDIAQGYIDLLYCPYLNLNTGVYYFAIEIYSNDNSNPVHVLNDLTILQPDDASAVYIPGDATYTYGNALAIRLQEFTGEGCWGLDENLLSGVAIYPNPSHGEFTVSNEDFKAITIEVYNLLGEKLVTKNANEETQLALSHLGAGVYVVKVSHEQESISERLIIE